MASANPNVTEMVTTTLRRRRKKLADNFSNHNMLLKKLRERGNMKLEPGGRTLVEELEYGSSGTFQYYTEYESFNMTVGEAFSAAEYDWKQASVLIQASGLEIRSNSGPEGVIPLLSKRIKNGEKDMVNNLAGSNGIYGDGSTSDGKAVGGLGLIAPTDGAGQVGGIPSGTFTFWKSQFDDDDIDDSTKVLGLMDAFWLTLVRGSDHPDIIAADPVSFASYWKALQTIQRLTDPNKARSGFRTLEFAGPSGFAEVFHDDQAPAKTMFFLNTEYLFWRSHQDANMTPMPEVRPVNQDSVAVPVIWQGNLTCSNRSLQGRLFES